MSNGKGHHARIVADVLLTKVFQQAVIDWAEGYDLQAMNERRAHYIKVLHATDGDDLVPLLRMFSVKE